MYRASEEHLLTPSFAENNEYGMPEGNAQFYQNLYLPEIALEMWDDDISSMYKMDFISVLTTTLDDKSFFINTNSAANPAVLQGTSSLIGDRDNVLDLKREVPSMIDITASDDKSFFNNTNSAANSAALQGTSGLVEDRDNVLGVKCEVPSMTDNTTSDSNDSSVKSWEETPVKQWTRVDVTQWIKHNLNSFGLTPYDSLSAVVDRFRNIDGLALCSMSLSDFLSVSNNYGHFLHSKLQECLCSENTDCELHQLVPIESSYKDIPSDVVSLMLSDSQLNFSQGLRDKLNKELNRELQSSVYLPTCLEEDFLNDQKEDSSISKKRPGRPRGIKRRKQSEQRLGRLWEFIRDLLLSEKYCPKYICWDNYEEGKFRFVESDKVAKLWGSIKGNANMNYEKFSRAMRYYYKSEVLLPVEGRRLVYKFGPKATGWRTANPNFKL